MGLAALSCHANTKPCSGPIVPLQKPRKAENQDRCHRDCRGGKIKHLECSPSEYHLGFCASVILSVNGVKKTQSQHFNNYLIVAQILLQEDYQDFLL